MGGAINLGMTFKTATSANSYSTIITDSEQFGVTGGTTTTLNTSTANIIVVGLSYYTSAGANLSDNKGNTWTQTTSYTDNQMSVTFFYCISPTVGTGHTFTTTSHFCGVNVWAGKGTSTPVYGSLSGFSQNASGNIQPGSLTPPAGNVMLFIFGSFNGADPGSTPPTGFTLIGHYPTATAEAGSAGYILQSSGTAQNPTCSSTGSSEAISLIYFK